MQFVCIEVNNSSDDVIKCISDELVKNNLIKLKYIVNKVISNIGISIICSIEETPNNSYDNSYYKELKLCISNALAEYIISSYEEKLIDKIIKSNYYCFNVLERKEIFNLVNNTLKNSNKNLINSILQYRRKNIIVKKLIEYLETSNTIILEGFINFRLKDYISDLEEIVDKAVDDFIMAKEYREFIRLLKYFVDIQTPKFEVINILVDYEGGYLLLDENKEEIADEYMKDAISEISEGVQLNNDDMLVSSLITLAPKKIIIHGINNFKNKELIETIKSVFMGRFLICEKCEMCGLSMVGTKK